MTVSNQQVRVNYLGDGVTVSFPIPFPFYLDTDIKVLLGTASQSSGYSISGGEDANGNPQPGSLTFSSAPALNVTVQAILNVPYTQLVELVDGTAFPSSTINQVNDRAVQALLRIADLMGRAILAPDGDVTPNMALPAAAARINTYLGFDSNGNLTLGQTLPSGTLSQAAIGLFLNPQTPAESAAGVTPANYAYAPGVVERYGADPTGTNDSTTAIVNAALSVGIGGSIVFQPNGLYKVTPNGNHTFLLQNKTNFIVQGNNATIRAANGSACGANDEMMMVRNCQDFLIENLIVDGNIANRTPSITTDTNIDIRDSSARGVFRKVRSINACMDGWAIQTSTESVQSSYPADIVLEDCTGENAWRNGLSITATQRCKVIRGRYINAGTTAGGTAPRNGIDVEPNTTTTYGNSDLTIQDVEVSGNANFGCNVGGSVVQNARVRISGLTGSLNTNGFLSIVNCNDLSVDDCMVGTHPNTSRGIIDIGTGTPVDIALRNISFAPQPSLSLNQHLIYDQGNVTGRLMIDGVKAYNVTSRAITTASDASVENVDIKTITQDAILAIGGVSSYRNITVDNCSGRGFYTNQPVEVDGLTLIDCASTLASAQFDTGSAGAAVRNVLVKQRTSIPGGAVGLFFNQTPACVQNVLCVSAGTNYTAANSITFSGGFGSARISGISPAPQQTILDLGNYANDAAAATGGVPVNGIYRNGSVLQVRVT